MNFPWWRRKQQERGWSGSAHSLRWPQESWIAAKTGEKPSEPRGANLETWDLVKEVTQDVWGGDGEDVAADARYG